MYNLKSKKLFLLDMDGTLYLDDELFPGAAEFLALVKARGSRYLFLTNNSSKGVKSYVEKMDRLGIRTAEDDFLTSVDALIVYLNLNYGDCAGGKKIYIMGTSSFKDQMADAGFNITDRLEDDIAMLIIGFDRELTFGKLEDACILLGRGVEYLATNPDWVCPTSYGFVPDCGSFAWMLEKATGRRPKFIGKPEPDMALLALKKFGCRAEDAMLIGDRLYIDIACGNNAGVDTAFVLSGEGTLADLESSETKPTYVFDNIEKILQEIK
ncbi:MAG: HAD-IIA family hydrolase [Firmicutes bacterium]|nr:HAD-IIA family hydrolase [Bacillota bacterium]